jgi:hypothetical protein
MKRLFVLAAFVFIAAIAANAQNKPNFAGSWSLDKTKSQGLDQRMVEGPDVTWAITQDDAKLTIESKLSGGQAPAGGGGGGRGPAGPRSYTLDGKEVTTEGGGQMGGTNTTKATWSGDGKTLELTSVRAGSFNGQDFKATTTDKMSMSADGKTLTVVRHSESPRGTTDSTMVFNKQ